MAHPISFKLFFALCSLALPQLAVCWQLHDIQECPISAQNKNWLDCTEHDAPARLPYKMDDGSTKLLDSRATVICRQGVCGYESQGANGLWYPTNEYAGQIQQQGATPILIHRGYYLGNGADGRIVAYVKGSGPEAGGPVAPRKAGDTVVKDVASEACVNAWGKDYHDNFGEDALVNNDQIEVWGEWCREGKKP